jgi:hypothetical protein
MRSLEEIVREVVEALAPLERRAGSAAEREAAQWLAERLRRTGARAEVEEVEFLDGYAGVLLPLGAATLACAGLARTRRGRWPSALLAALAGAALADDASNGARWWRRLTAPRKQTWNVVAQTGDLGAPRTLVVLAHHDAAPTGRVFDQRAQRWFARTFPTVVARIDTSPPLWWPVAGGPWLVALGAALRSRGLLTAGAALGAGVCGLALDVARSPVVPGANDNLSAVAALVALAEHLAEQPPPGLRVLLVSCGAEEVLQGGIYGFARAHFPRLAPDRTWFVNLDTIGSPELLLVEGEGPFWMEEYHEPEFRDLVAAAAERSGRPVRRGVRARVSTDAVLPSRAGYPTASLASWEPDTKLLSNYHLMTDTPENLCYRTVVEAIELVLGVAGDLADPSRSDVAPISTLS